MATCSIRIPLDIPPERSIPGPPTKGAGDRLTSGGCRAPRSSGVGSVVADQVDDADHPPLGVAGDGDAGAAGARAEQDGAVTGGVEPQVHHGARREARAADEGLAGPRVVAPADDLVLVAVLEQPRARDALAPLLGEPVGAGVEDPDL